MSSRRPLPRDAAIESLRKRGPSERPSSSSSSNSSRRSSSHHRGHRDKRPETSSGRGGTSSPLPPSHLNAEGLERWRESRRMEAEARENLEKLKIARDSIPWQGDAREVARRNAMQRVHPGDLLNYQVPDADRILADPRGYSLSRVGAASGGIGYQSFSYQSSASAGSAASSSQVPAYGDAQHLPQSFSSQQTRGTERHENLASRTTSNVVEGLSQPATDVSHSSAAVHGSQTSHARGKALRRLLDANGIKWRLNMTRYRNQERDVSYHSRIIRNANRMGLVPPSEADVFDLFDLLQRERTPSGRPLPRWLFGPVVHEHGQVRRVQTWKQWLEAVERQLRANGVAVDDWPNGADLGAAYISGGGDPES